MRQLLLWLFLLWQQCNLSHLQCYCSVQIDEHRNFKVCADHRVLLKLYECCCKVPCQLQCLFFRYSLFRLFDSLCSKRKFMSSVPNRLLFMRSEQHMPRMQQIYWSQTLGQWKMCGFTWILRFWVPNCSSMSWTMFYLYIEHSLHCLLEWYCDNKNTEQQLVCSSSWILLEQSESGRNLPEQLQSVCVDNSLYCLQFRIWGGKSSMWAGDITKFGSSLGSFRRIGCGNHSGSYNNSNL